VVIVAGTCPVPKPGRCNTMAGRVRSQRMTRSGAAPGWPKRSVLPALSAL
jgi:hypothetical protein